MDTPKISTKTPIRLQKDVCKAFADAYSGMIDEHGASYAVNFVLAHHLRKRGHLIPDLETPAERISQGQAKRWASAKEVLGDADEQLEKSRELKRARDARYRAKKRAEKKAAKTSTKE